jgi:hypothetical protein
MIRKLVPMLLAAACAMSTVASASAGLIWGN